MIVHRKIYTYRYLLAASQQAFVRATQSKDVEFIESLNILLFTALALEAFLNHIGAQSVTHWPPLKKKLSPMEKLEVLTAQRGVGIEWDKSPYQSFKLAFQFRNLIAHAETELLEVKPGRSDVVQPKAKWESYCKLGTAERVLKDVVQIIRTLPVLLGLEQDSPEFILSENV